jgi:hypothetical protein
MTPSGSEKSNDAANQHRQESLNRQPLEAATRCFASAIGSVDSVDLAHFWL